MPSLRKKVSSYFRQLSFYNEPRDKKYNINENSFVTKYLEGQIAVKDGPAILYGKNPTDLPNYDLDVYDIGPDSIVGCYSGPNGGLTTVKRLEKHLSVPDSDIDYIDTTEEIEVPVKSSPSLTINNKVDNTTMLIKVAGQEYLVTNRKKQHDNNKSHSLGSLSDIEVEIEKTKICAVNNNSSNVKCRNRKLDNRVRDSCERKKSLEWSNSSNYGLSKSKSEGNPFQQKKTGKIIRIASRQNDKSKQHDVMLPDAWNCKSDFVYGISDSLYDKNQVTKSCNGDPIADCFGVIARNDSAILAVADGVNWGEKASIAAKSAVHGCLHYLDKTIFNDTKPFDDLDTKYKSTPIFTEHRINNTRDVFVCLLRAFNCAHDLILENDGMLTTLTVAVVLPLKPKNVLISSQGEESYVCCVCNVGDTLAYVYSHKYGVRELTKGSHDIYCNRDMRDALGALGPVDGINPELSNLTLSLTMIHKGDIVMIASDGLTDNFDPNVCKFTVNTKDVLKLKPQPSSSREPPLKPPRKNKPVVQYKSEHENPFAAEFARQSSHSPSNTSNMGKPRSANTTVPKLDVKKSTQVKTNTGFLRSKTSLDMRSSAKVILRNEDGIPFVTPLQRYEISLLLMEDILKRGISGHDIQCTTAKKVCENLVDFTFSISSAKRHTLEDADLYFDNLNGVMVEISQQEKKSRRRKGLERVQNLPGKLDHEEWNITKAMIVYHKTTCIRFIQRTLFDKDWIHITQEDWGCYSKVGRVGGPQIVNLEPPNCLRMEVILHELMHAIGFIHEHSRWDRDNYINIHTENIRKGTEENFMKVKFVQRDFSYDYESLMHYGQYAFSKNGKPTITSKKRGVVITKPKVLSKKDIDKVRLLYNCTDGGCSTKTFNYIMKFLFYILVKLYFL